MDKVKRIQWLLFKYKDVEVTLKPNGNATGVYVTSPTQELSAIRIKWKYNVASTVKYLGDHWERSYGDLQWKTSLTGVKNPWYVLIYNSQERPVSV